ncbi:hypothetical protein ACFQ88_27225 [Paenibacillus sp. NPDC056579]|uniref:hypothetical protein n=1 Tax=Paenibacillus sp. NPDC056579 TaxID=3345871 RepID=UPI0036A65DA7
MAAIANARTLSVSIERTPVQVYDYVFELQHFPEWATSFSLSIQPSHDGWWVVTTPDGPMNLKLVERNEFGVLDHHVYVGDGQPIMNAMRVVANGSGSEFLFTMFQQPGMSDEQFAHDAGMVERDLHSLKKVLESRTEL